MFRDFGRYRLVYAHLWSTYGQYWQVRVAFLMRIVSRMCKLIALPIAISLIITGLSHRNYRQAEHAVFVYAVFSFLLGLLTPLTQWVGMLGENQAYDRIAGEYFSRLVAADLDHFNSNLAGYLTTATRQYIDSCMQLARGLRDRYLDNFLTIVFPIGVITWLDPVLGSVTIFLGAVQATYLLWSAKVITKYRSQTRDIYKRNSGFMSDVVSNILAVKASAQEAARVQTLRGYMHEESALFSHRWTIQARLISLRELITVIFFAVLLWLTVQRMQSGAITITAAVLVATYTTTILNAIYAISDNLDEHDDLVDKIIPAFEILKRTNVVQDPADPQKLDTVKGDIVFSDVSFAYDIASGGQQVLSGFSLHIPAGQKLGVVGLSGAGKSTLVKLLLRFNDVSGGSVSIDAVNVRDMRQADLRRQISYVPQEPLLFHASIRDNITLSKPDATAQEVRRALQRAHALTFVDKLPDGMDSIVGERGVRLSGGQKQRIAIARAVLQEAPIMVLDEATSALDSESEQIIKDSFARILRGKTAIVIAHRLSTLSEMDRIVVIENGRIAEDGTHRELLALGGKYAHLWSRQQRHLDDPESVPDGTDPALLPAI